MGTAPKSAGNTKRGLTRYIDSTDKGATAMVPKICTEMDCGRKHKARGFCNMHYLQWTRAVPPEQRPDLSVPDEERFWSKVDKSGDCWIWQAACYTTGRGMFRINGRQISAHRVSYEFVNGPIPDGLEIDHICRVRPCVRPSHLRAVTHKQNVENHGGPTKRSKTGARGVEQQRRGRPRATVVHNHVRYYLGTFETVEEANAAAIAKRNELHTHNDYDRQANN